MRKAREGANEPSAAALIVMMIATGMILGLLKGITNPTASDSSMFFVLAGLMLVVLHRMWHRQDSLATSLAYLTALFALGGTLATKLVQQREDTGYLILLVAAASLLLYFRRQMAHAVRARWWYNLGGVIGSVGVAILTAGTLLLPKCIEYFGFVWLAALFFAVAAVAKGERVARRQQAHAQLPPASGEALKQEKVKDKLKEEIKR